MYISICICKRSFTLIIVNDRLFVNSKNQKRHNYHKPLHCSSYFSLCFFFVFSAIPVPARDLTYMHFSHRLNFSKPRDYRVVFAIQKSARHNMQRAGIPILKQILLSAGFFCLFFVLHFNPDTGCKEH